jgi:hypothetical protein
MFKSKYKRDMSKDMASSYLRAGAADCGVVGVGVGVGAVGGMFSLLGSMATNVSNWCLWIVKKSLSCDC